MTFAAPWTRAMLMACGLVAVSSPVLAQENDTLVLRANAGATYNSNVLGISNELPQTLVEQLLQGRSQGAWIWSLGAGLRLDLPVSRQRFVLDASVTRNAYNQYNELDYTGYDVRGIWNWRVGNDWHGQINGGATQSRQTDTSGIVFNLPQLVKNYDALVDVHYSLTSRWDIYGSLAAAQARYNAAALQFGNVNTTSESVGAMYRSPLGNGTGLRLTAQQGKWPNRPPLGIALLDNAYTQYTLAMVIDWRPTGRSKVAGDIGYTTRDRATVSNQNTVGGPSGRLTYNYSLTGKSQVEASVYQTFGPLDDPTASYARTTGLDLTYSYQATAKVVLQANASYQNVNYLGESLIPGALQRRDTYMLLGVSGRYQATRTLSFACGAQYQNRASNIQFAAYDVYLVYFNAGIEF